MIIGGGTNPPEFRQIAMQLAGGKSAKWVNIPSAGTDQEIADALAKKGGIDEGDETFSSRWRNGRN